MEKEVIIEIPVDKNDDTHVAMLFIQDWIFKLGLDKTLEIMPYIIFDPKFYLYGHVKACAGWNYVKNAYVIVLGRLANKKYILLHEVGEIYLKELVKKREYVKKENISETIYEKEYTQFDKLFNAVWDGFVNYNLKCNGALPILAETHPARQLKIIQKTVDELPFYEHIGQYIYNYLMFNYILPQSKKRSISNKINLKILKEIALKKAKSENILFNEGKFIVLNKLLDGFDKLKDTHDFMVILRFTWKIVTHLGIIPKTELLKEIQSKFKHS